MTRVKLNLASGSVQEREVVTAFNSNGIKYIIFDGESTGSMGLPIILVGKETAGKVVGITDAEEWKNTKECLKKIISGEKVEYAFVANELKADDIYYRQLTLPIASFDILKSSYVAPAEASTATPVDETPVFEQITPEDIAGGSVANVEPVAPSFFNTPIPEPTFTPQENQIPVVNESEAPTIEPQAVNNPTETNIPVDNAVQSPSTNNYEELKKEFLAGAEELFNNLYNKLNHND
jgi:hypothetical protein